MFQNFDSSLLTNWHESNMARVLYIGYASSVVTDALVHPFIQWQYPKHHAEPLKKPEAMPTLSKMYKRKAYAFTTDPSRLLILPLSHMFLFSYVRTARALLTYTVDEPKVRAHVRKLSQLKNPTWSQSLHIDTLLASQKQLPRRCTKSEKIQFYAQQYSLYALSACSLLTSSIYYACARSMCNVLEFRRNERDHCGRVLYPSFIFALRETNRRRGIYSWFPTCLIAGCTTAMLSYALPLFFLMNEAAFNPRKEREPIARRLLRDFSRLADVDIEKSLSLKRFHLPAADTFLANMEAAMALCAVGVTASIPFQAALSAFRADVWLHNLYNKELRTFRQYARSERQHLRHILHSSRKFIRRNSLKRFLIHANPYAMGKTGLLRSCARHIVAKSLPFSFCWAVYRALGGPVG